MQERSEEQIISRLLDLENDGQAERRVQLTGERFLSLLHDPDNGRSYVLRHGTDPTEGAEIPQQTECYEYPPVHVAQRALQRLRTEPRRAGERLEEAAALRTGPFKLAEAIPLGVTRGQLRGPGYCRLGAGLYRWAGLNENPQLILSAFARRLPVGAAFSGCTAAWLHGLDVAPCDPIEVTIPEPIGSSRRAGASVRRAALSGDEIALRRGLPATSALRTVVDLGGRDSLIEGVVAADRFLHAALVTIAELRTYVAGHPRAKGVARLRRVVDLAEPKAES